MSTTRQINITGGKDRLRALVMDLSEQLAGDGDVEAEVTVPPNNEGEPALLLNLNSTGCEDEDEVLVDYEEIDPDAEEDDA